MKRIIFVWIMLAGSVMLMTSCKDRATERKIAELEGKIAQLEGTKAANPTATATPATTA